MLSGRAGQGGRALPDARRVLRRLLRVCRSQLARRRQGRTELLGELETEPEEVDELGRGVDLGLPHAVDDQLHRPLPLTHFLPWPIMVAAQILARYLPEMRSCELSAARERYRRTAALRKMAARSFHGMSAHVFCASSAPAMAVYRRQRARSSARRTLISASSASWYSQTAVAWSAGLYCLARLPVSTCASFVRRRKRSKSRGEAADRHALWR